MKLGRRRMMMRREPWVGGERERSASGPNHQKLHDSVHCTALLSGLSEPSTASFLHSMQHAPDTQSCKTHVISDHRLIQPEDQSTAKLLFLNLTNHPVVARWHAKYQTRAKRKSLVTTVWFSQRIKAQRSCCFWTWQINRWLHGGMLNTKPGPEDFELLFKLNKR